MEITEEIISSLADEVSKRLNAHLWEKYPVVIRTRDIAEIMNCSVPTALKLIRIAQSSGLPVVWLSQKQPRINRDHFRSWWEGQVGPIDLTDPKRKK